jgi:hypothetical protein
MVTAHEANLGGTPLATTGLAGTGSTFTSISLPLGRTLH